MAFNYLFQSPQTWLKMSRQVGSDWKAITQAVTCNITCNSTFSSQLKVWAVGHMTPHESVGRIIASVVIIIYQFISDFHLIWRKNATVTTGNSPNSQADVIAYSFYSNWLPQDGTTGPALPVYCHLCFKDVREDSEKGQPPGQKTCQVRGNGGGDCELDELGNDTAEENRTPEDYRGWESWGDRWWGRRGNVEGCEWVSERAVNQMAIHHHTHHRLLLSALCVCRQERCPSRCCGCEWKYKGQRGIGPKNRHSSQQAGWHGVMPQPLFAAWRHRMPRHMLMWTKSHTRAGVGTGWETAWIHFLNRSLNLWV